ncbi:MAG: undecaprenyl-diphosphate phosphatase, partial [Pseudomonadota bacterium]
MDLVDIVMLALIQGVTEFLPISSSGHLALWPLLTGREDQGVTMDVAVHLGTLVAVCLYFRRDVARLFAGAWDVARGRLGTAEARLALLIILATLPAVLAGIALKLSGAMESLRTIEVIGWTTLIGGALLWAADHFGPQHRSEPGWTWRGALLMGLAQAMALIPGTSRAGACMTMARALGFERSEAARLALLMAVPTILAAGLVETAGVVVDGNLRLGAELALGALLSCLAALLALTIMMRMFAATWTMLPFVIYRLLLGSGLLWL